jgi:hypothetical protein
MLASLLGLQRTFNSMSGFVFCVAELLNLAPNSKDAQVFEQYAKKMGGAPTSAPGQFVLLPRSLARSLYIFQISLHDYCKLNFVLPYWWQK